MKYIEESLSQGEEIRQLFQPHWFAKIPIFFWTILVVTVPVALLLWLQLRALEQGVTNKRVIRKAGIVSRKTEEMRLSSIETVDVSQTFWQRIFGAGTVKVTGRGVSDVILVNIDDPMSVKRAIENAEVPPTTPAPVEETTPVFAVAPGNHYWMVPRESGEWELARIEDRELRLWVRFMGKAPVPVEDLNLANYDIRLIERPSVSG